MNKLHIPDPKKFEDKLRQIKEYGLEKLYIVSDFDRTLTGEAEDGSIVTTSWAIFKEELGPEYAAKRQALFDQYYPIEWDNALDMAYRLEQMATWWRKHTDLLVEYRVDRSMVARVLANEKLKLRGGVEDLMRFAAAHNMPFFIFSAGIGNAIEVFLDLKDLKTNNVHIISNFLEFDTQGYVVGLQGPIIHALNKNEGQLAALPSTDQASKRPNCILLGDSIHDATITDGASHATVLKIGFLNGNQRDLARFEAAYDAILMGDTDIGCIRDALKGIL
jgi:HAD superfamily hydrolase (TIGR01544 family)